MKWAISFFVLPFYGLIGGEIPKGAHLLLRMVNSVDTRTAREGDQVYLQTASPIAVDDAILVPVGSYVQGTVSSAKRSGRVTGRAEIAIRLDKLTLANGKAYRIAPQLRSVDSNGTDQKVRNEENTIRQGSDHGRDAAQIAILAGSGA